VTSNVARPALGSIKYGGVGIDDCTEPGVIALTFDDGPYIYTSAFLLRRLLSFLMLYRPGPRRAGAVQRDCDLLHFGQQQRQGTSSLHLPFAANVVQGQ
jgi:hypothetical protein